MRFEIGDVVKIRKTSVYYGHGKTSGNPMKTEGVIIQTRLGDHQIRVRWDNRRKNSYNEEDLGLVRRS